MRVYEYVDRRGKGVYTEWLKRLQPPQQAALDAKLDVVRAAGEPGDQNRGELPPNLFRGPVKHRNKFYPNTYKLTVNSGGALRPLACKGPVDESSEWTIVNPVTEKGGQYPPDCFAVAESRRREILADPVNRRRLLDGEDEDVSQG